MSLVNEQAAAVICLDRQKGATRRPHDAIPVLRPASARADENSYKLSRVSWHRARQDRRVPEAMLEIGFKLA